MVIKAKDLRSFGFYWMRTKFDDGSFDVEIVEYRFESIAKCGDDRFIFPTEYELIDNCEFVGPIAPPDELLHYK